MTSSETKKKFLIFFPKWRSWIFPKCSKQGLKSFLIDLLHKATMTRWPMAAGIHFIPQIRPSKVKRINILQYERSKIFLRIHPKYTSQEHSSRAWHAVTDEIKRRSPNIFPTGYSHRESVSFPFINDLLSHLFFQSQLLHDGVHLKMQEAAPFFSKFLPLN